MKKSDKQVIQQDFLQECKQTQKRDTELALKILLITTVICTVIIIAARIVVKLVVQL